MELRKDPITRSWVVVGGPEHDGVPLAPCPLCPGNEGQSQTLLSWPQDGNWQVRVFPHPRPLYRIEAETGRSAEGIYDRMGPVGAHELIAETPQHAQPLAQLSDEAIERVLEAYAQRIRDLKGDPRFKYVTVFKNSGNRAGEEWEHAYSQVTATTFVPRRILYELRASREWYREHERCVFCDIIRQEERRGKLIVDAQGDYLALCPYASRAPFEMWVLPRPHNSQFENPGSGSQRRHLAALLGRTLRRLSQIALGYHMVLHTAPNTSATKASLSEYWKTIAADYHWHIEILPILEKRTESYAIKETYFNAVYPEDAAERLRQLDAGR